jgi:small subunit ribosomal protein S9
MESVIALGRRKSAVARVTLKTGTGKVTINKKDVADYVNTDVLRFKVNQPFAITDTEGKYDIVANIDGGGVNGQVEALRLGITRALVSINEEWKPALKEAGLTTRDPRMVERKKPGQKKARKKFQFSKR